MSKRTITLTGRPPVSIDEDAWPVIAKSTDNDFDGQYDFQANRTSDWNCRVRRHEDGRAIVYATYSFDCRFQGERNLEAKRGELLPAGTSDDDICAAIARVCADIADAEHHGEDASRWPTLAADCVADMPSHELA